MKQFDVFGIGNAVVDCVYLIDDSFLQENNIDKGMMTLVDKLEQKKLINKIKSNAFIQSGGSVSNSIFVLSQLGGSAYLSFLVSDDEFGNIFIKDLKKNGVNTGNITYTTSEGDMTGSCLVFTTPDGERTMITCLSISSKFSKKNINYNDLKYANYFYIEGFLVTSQTALEAIYSSISFCKKNNVKVALTFSDISMVRFFKDRLKRILDNKIDLLFCNEEEALEFSVTNNIEEALGFLRKLSKRTVLTRGDKGSLIYNQNEIISINPVPTKALDSVGAGDMFAGAFLYGLNNGLSLIKSGNLASALSSKVVSKIGPRLDINDIIDIKKSLI